MSQLGDVLRIGAVAVEEMSSLHQLLDLPSTALSICAFDDLVANWGSWDYDHWDLVLNA